MKKEYIFLKSILESENAKLEIFKSGLISGKVAFPHECAYCKKEILSELSLKINPDYNYENNFLMSYYHIECFSNLVREIESQTYNILDELEAKISKLSERTEALNKIKVFQTISSDYGMHYLEFIDKAITNYTQNNPTPISFANELDFQKYISLNTSKIDNSIEISNNQIAVDSGELDLLGTDRSGNSIIIEVKLIATYYTVSQVLFYINSLSKSKKIPMNKIRGIIVGMEIHPNLIHATTTFNNLIRNEINNIEIYKFDSSTRSFINVLTTPPEG